MDSENTRPADVIQVGNHLYVLASSTLVDQRTRVLKEGDSFAVFDVYGDVQPIGTESQGLFSGSTRFLSKLDLSLGGSRLLLLSSTINHDNAVFTIDLMNSEFRDTRDRLIRHGSVHVIRSKFLYDDICYEKIQLTNYSSQPVSTSLSLLFESDYADIFEVRGMKRTSRGERKDPLIEEKSVTLSYAGLDQIIRETEISFVPAPARLSDSQAEFFVDLKPREKMTLSFSVTCRTNDTRRPDSYGLARLSLRKQLKENREQDCQIESSNIQFNEWIYRSLSDLHVMVTKTIHGFYPYAGVPWFNTVFGRDGIITSLQALWVNPRIAKGVLSYLAATQATEQRPHQDAEPGKILHEVRSGEMVATGQVPFQRYYGSADATPLFVVLAEAYLERTGDLDFIRSLWPHLKSALKWIDKYGDKDGDGYVEYFRQSSNGLTNQGWKDSFDSISHSDGRLAEGPIALCEVQGYVYAAKRAAAHLCRFLKEPNASEFEQSADLLQRKFHQDFWSERLGTYVLALDGQKNQCEVRSSNVGHCLFADLIAKERAGAVAQSLMGADMFSGWGIRTLSQLEKNYNPMSYHNGSVWPHDTAIVADGFARYGRKDLTLKVLNGLFDASAFMDLHRLPELFCGFDRRAGEGPTLYPVACSPQAWAAGSVFLLLKACLGIEIRGGSSQLHFRHPVLPSSIQWLEIRNLQIGLGKVDLLITRHKEDVGLNILRREGQVEIAVLK